MAEQLVELRPGDTLNIIWTSVQDTPLGPKEMESNFQFTYDELLARLRTKGRAGKSRRSGTAGARFSRIVALATNALKKGRWSTGAEIDRDEVFDKLMTKSLSLSDSEYKNITGNARKSLKSLSNSESLLKPAQRKELSNMLRAIGIEN